MEQSSRFTGATFHPGNIALLKQPKKKQPKYPIDYVRVEKPTPRYIPVLNPKTSFAVENPHMLYTAANCPTMFRTWLQFMGQSITERYIYFGNIRAIIADKSNCSFLKSRELLPYTRQLLVWAKREQNVRTQMRKLVALWLRKRYESRMLNTEDPATLAEPEKPILIFDSKARGSYVFEASTIKRQFEENLGYCKWLVSEPQAPKNPMTNLKFHTGQVAEIFRQLAIYGRSSWLLEGFKEHHYNLADFLETFRQPLRMRNVDHCHKNPTCEDTQEFVEEFMEDEFEYHDIPYRSNLTILKWALKHKTDLKYIKTWIDVWAEYYKLIIVHGEQTLRDNPRLLNFVHDMTADLFRNKTMILKLGRMRLEVVTKERAEQPPPQVDPSTWHLPSSTFDLTASIQTQPFNYAANTLISADGISVALLEALLHYEPPSD
jgi:hypothetical protein